MNPMAIDILDQDLHAHLDDLEAAFAAAPQDVKILFSREMLKSTPFNKVVLQVRKQLSSAASYVSMLQQTDDELLQHALPVWMERKAQLETLLFKVRMAA